MKNLAIIVQGSLRNRGFRFSAMQKAYECEVRGYIAKGDNGSYIMEVEGEESNLNKFVDWCRKGPLGTKVTDVEIKEVELKNFASFEMK